MSVYTIGRYKTHLYYFKGSFYCLLHVESIATPTPLFFGGGGDRGAGARENRGWEGYGRRERKGREAGVLREREAGEKCKTLFLFIQQYVTILPKTRTENIFDLHLTSSR